MLCTGMSGMSITKKNAAFVFASLASVIVISTVIFVRVPFQTSAVPLGIRSDHPVPLSRNASLTLKAALALRPPPPPAPPGPPSNLLKWAVLGGSLFVIVALWDVGDPARRS